VSDRPGLREPEPEHGLPSLLDWGDALYEATLRAEHSRRERRRRVSGRLIGVLVLVGVLAVPGAVVATRSILSAPASRGPALTSPAVRLVEGSAGDVRWRVRGWNAGAGRICLRVAAYRGVQRVLASEACPQERTAARLTMTLATGPTVTLVVGTAAAGVERVRVAPAAGAPLDVPAQRLAADVLRRSRLGDARVYVAVFPHGAGSGRLPRLTAYDAGGRALASTVGDDGAS
jgi:hypothetical protein